MLSNQIDAGGVPMMVLLVAVQALQEQGVRKVPTWQMLT